MPFDEGGKDAWAKMVVEVVGLGAQRSNSSLHKVRVSYKWQGQASNDLCLLEKWCACRSTKRYSSQKAKMIGCRQKTDRAGSRFNSPKKGWREKEKYHQWDCSTIIVVLHERITGMVRDEHVYSVGYDICSNSQPGKEKGTVLSRRMQRTQKNNVRWGNKNKTKSNCRESMMRNRGKSEVVEGQ